MSKDKFIGFPKVYALSLTEGIERRENFTLQCDELGIDYEVITVDRYPECGTKLQGNIMDHLPEGHTPVTAAVTANHIRMWRHWLQTSDSSWAIFCEDDIDFKSTSKHWPFTWSEFMTIVSEDAKVVQLCIISDNLNSLRYRKRNSHSDWGCNAYLVKREYAERIVDYICDPSDDNIFKLEVPYWVEVGTYRPCLPEDYVYVDYTGNDYLTLEGMYAIPLFIEDRNLNSFFSNDELGFRERGEMFNKIVSMWKDYEQEVLSWNK